MEEVVAGLEHLVFVKLNIRCDGRLEGAGEDGGIFGRPARHY